MTAHTSQSCCCQLLSDSTRNASSSAWQLVDACESHWRLHLADAVISKVQNHQSAIIRHKPIEVKG
jgi:hypothetical protein